MPQTPWPDVQPPETRVPNPASTPPTTSAGQPASNTIASGPWPVTARYTTVPPIRPPTNHSRQAASPRCGGIRPATMPLTPAMRPDNSSIIAAATPISAPPASADSGSKLTISMALPPVARLAAEFPARRRRCPAATPHTMR